jgi:hypothetical protein
MNRHDRNRVESRLIPTMGGDGSALCKLGLEPKSPMSERHANASEAERKSFCPSRALRIDFSASFF